MEDKLSDQITEDGMGVAHDTYGGEMCIKGFGEKTWRKKITWKT
jgi:hypothetical protein